MKRALILAFSCRSDQSKLSVMTFAFLWQVKVHGEATIKVFKVLKVCSKVTSMCLFPPIDIDRTLLFTFLALTCPVGP